MNNNLYTWDFLIDNASYTVKNYADRLKTIPQSYSWHPEGNVEIHTKIVMNRAQKSKDTDIIFAAFYHDLGKVDTTEPNGKGVYSAHDHEKISAKLVSYDSDGIKKYANVDCVEWLVKNHMRAKYLDSMRLKKKKELMDNLWFSKLKIFLECDNMMTLNILEVISAGGNPFKFYFNKIRSFFD